jgi:hypothetical protein
MSFRLQIQKNAVVPNILRARIIDDMPPQLQISVASRGYIGSAYVSVGGRKIAGNTNTILYL